jgi:hypothetical protein
MSPLRNQRAQTIVSELIIRMLKNGMTFDQLHWRAVLLILTLSMRIRVATFIPNVFKFCFVADLLLDGVSCIIGRGVKSLDDCTAGESKSIIQAPVG